MSAVTPFGEAQQPYLLIDYEWHDSVSEELVDDLSAFARLARSYDSEAGFTALDEVAGPTDPAPAGWLVVRDGHRPAAEELPGPAIVAVVTVAGLDEFGVGTAPWWWLRSIGRRGSRRCSSRSCTPRLLLPWFGTGIRGVRAIADGDHPAAGRIGREFGFDVVEETWWLLRMIRQPFAVVPGTPNATVTVVESVQPAVLHRGVAVPAAAGDDVSAGA